MADRLTRLFDHAKAQEPRLQIGRIVKGQSGLYRVITNGRGVPRDDISLTDLALNEQGHGEGDEILVQASELNDKPVIVGHSPWLVNQLGTEWDEE